MGGSFAAHNFSARSLLALAASALQDACERCSVRANGKGLLLFWYDFQLVGGQNFSDLVAGVD